MNRAILHKAAYFVLFLLLQASLSAQSFITPFEQGDGNQSASYPEVIDFYNNLANSTPHAEMVEVGQSDAGEPMHLFYVAKNTVQPEAARYEGKTVLFILNGIHPGESEGIDASMMFARDVLKLAEMEPLLENLVIGIIPVYNIGGALNRRCCTRANQNGPEEQGFRGNAQNLDLNRDFIKADSKNTFAFYKAFHFLKPDVFIDMHTSNGADYQYVMTLISTQYDKLGGERATLMEERFDPALYQRMKDKGHEMSPYVNVFGNVPDSGFSQFLETPRYSTGYTASWNVLSYVAESHMLKPFDQRVEASYALLVSLAENMVDHTRAIQNTRKRISQLNNGIYSNWELDKSTSKTLSFKGYEATYVPSAVTGLKRLSYNRSKPFTKSVKYYDDYKGIDWIDAPLAYVIPQGWHQVIKSLEANGVQMLRLGDELATTLGVYYIERASVPKAPYEGHYYHGEVALRRDSQKISLRAGDYLITPSGNNWRFIQEVLEPQFVDSYFRWNFFDAVLQQKEWFSSYVFEDIAAELLTNNDSLNNAFKAEQQHDTTFAQDAFRQLYFIYRHSPYYEKEHNRYPVFRVENVKSLQKLEASSR